MVYHKLYLAAMTDILPFRWIRRYKIFFFVGLLILVLQIFLAYKSLRIPLPNLGHSFLPERGSNDNSIKNLKLNSELDDDDINSNLNVPIRTKDSSSSGLKPSLNPQQLGFEPECEITTKDAISAIQRAKTVSCKQQIANITCAIQSGLFYAASLPTHCPRGNYTANKILGCYKDEKEFRLLSGYFTNFKWENSPKKCIQLCLQSGFPYAGVQYSTECFCGNDEPSTTAKLPDSSCNMKCSGNAKEACGGYFTINVFETGIQKFTPQIAETSLKQETKNRVRIAFLLTLNGRALRQVFRLIKALYSPEHVFYIHVDSRQDYLYRELLKLEDKFSNIKLSRTRFSTIWGGASLLEMLLSCMKDLLASTWKWDFVINLSESDFPVKTIDKLVDFLSANRDKNFVKSHGRETQRFIQKQGLDKTFVECDTHMWRIGDRLLPHNIQIDGGSDWVALSRKFVDFVTRPDGNELLKGLLNVFKYTLLPAESFFHTFLRNSKFCNTYVDNNLHVTNWKRKMGCKCQYKNVVDWCGCSPNDFKTEDWPKLQGTEHKLIFFARKFEPIINQAVILQVEEWLFGPYTSDFTNLNSYWQNYYHFEDVSPAPDDAAITITYSILRMNGKNLNYDSFALKEITNYKLNDEYKGFLIRYIAKSADKKIEYETRIRPNQLWQVARNSIFARRIKSFEVSSEYDQKEQTCRNLAKFLGPFTDLTLVIKFLGSEHAENHSYNFTVLWIDPAGAVQDYNEIHVEDGQSDTINFSKANLKHPMVPGVWTAKLIGKSQLFAQSKFLVTPLEIDKNKMITRERSEIINLGTKFDLKYPEKWQQYLPSSSELKLLQSRFEINSKRFGANLSAWIDSLVVKFFFVRETCIIKPMSYNTTVKLPLCTETNWSSLASDPKSDVYSLLNR